MRVPVRRGVIVVGAATLVAGCDLGSAAVVHTAPSRLVEVVDVDGDGALDVLTAGPRAYQVLVNDGSGGLSGAPVPVEIEIAAFAVGDVDGDGAVDRVDVTHTPSGPTSLLLSSSGGGAFGTPVVAVADVGSSGANDVDVVDIDRDGDGDLLVAGRFGVQVFHNDGAETFTSGGFYGGPCGGVADRAPVVATELTHIDFEADGDDDVLLAGYCDYHAPSAIVGVLRNNGTGYLGSAALAGVTSPDGSLAGLSVADVNEDGNLDVVVGNPGASSVEVVPGVPGGWLGSNHITVAVAAPPGDLEVADIDEDGHLDLVVTSAGAGFARVLYGTGSGAFPESHVVATSGDVVGPLAVGRIDADGSVDVVFGNDSETTDPSVAVLLNTLDGRQH
jgi:hypothetical protein